MMRNLHYVALCIQYAFSLNDSHCSWYHLSTMGRKLTSWLCLQRGCSGTSAFEMLLLSTAQFTRVSLFKGQYADKRGPTNSNYDVGHHALNSS